MNQHAKPPGIVTWTGYIALTLLLLLPLSVLIVRAGEWQQGLLLYAIACVGSLLLLLLSAALLVLPRFTAWRRDILRLAIPTLPGSLLLLTLVLGGNYPRIHDITTDTSDPPAFTMAEQQRGATANPLATDPSVIRQQEAAYPDLRTLPTALEFDAAFDRALLTATALGWEVYHEDRNAGFIEAVDTTRIMGFKDDVVIRLRTSADGTIVDLRSVSRVGQGDIGANAKRIRKFIEAFKEQG